MIIWEARHPLAIDEDGVLWHWVEAARRWRRLGRSGDATVPPEGEAAAAELADLWADRYDERAEQLASYWRSVGA